MRLRIALGAGAALALAGAMVAVAQPAPPKEGPTPRFEHRGPDRLMLRHGPEDRAERLKTMLQLTPAQEPALKTYLAAVAPPEPDAFMQRMDDDRTPPTAVERADRAADMAGRMAAEARKRADATRAFYAALTPSQRKVFDTLPGGGPRIMQIRHMRGEGPPPPPRPPMPPEPPAPPPPPGRAG